MRRGFVFQRRAASEQCRLFAGPLLPGTLLRPGLLPAVPYPNGLAFQALHADDAAAAFALAVLRDARGAFNLAAEPVVDGPALARLLAGRPVPVAPRLVRAALAGAWWTHLLPVEPALFDLAMGLPIMRTDRPRQELDWSPAVRSTGAIAETLQGIREGAGGGTGPLAPDGPA
ncbi:MAG: NAD-dependent epimerase, partial [Acidimicrobiales bacterium]